MLVENFLRYDGKGDVPNQIHSYLSSNFKDLRNWAKGNPTLRAKAKDRWYVPDPNKATDLDKLRERALLREFKEYRESRQRRLKVFRLEAVRAGFWKGWQERDYATVIAVARKIADPILHEDPNSSCGTTRPSPERVRKEMFEGPEELIRKISLGEDTSLQFKSVRFRRDRVSAPGRDALADELAALGNTRAGTLVLGVDDETRDVTGIPVDRLDAVERYVFEICNESITPPLHWTLREFAVR